MKTRKIKQYAVIENITLVPHWYADPEINEVINFVGENDGRICKMHIYDHPKETTDGITTIDVVLTIELSANKMIELISLCDNSRISITNSTPW